MFDMKASARHGPNRAPAAQKSLFVVLTASQGKAKKNAWQKLIDKGVTADQAQVKYVALAEELKTKLGYDANKVPEAVGSS